ncbi:hypothetical protein H310_01116 [Aphanomyces invadans]|uniref:Uncharacterized protein n=1 Tax=Aphanomyces invadans TaxID=157072 RepID=A0A024UQW3_9STRA|nr:hypothetical protein H310_01116 [Aphanomyces invadans]ETW08560.1 hypothetical protein H310_01116 [Aphanomyces invadans]|eukprot:XP_008862365.1 hypothetical protein H310_01116 [Aphanomyces invadans]
MDVMKSLQHDVDAVVATHYSVQNAHVKGPSTSVLAQSLDASEAMPGKRSRVPSSNAVTEDLPYDHDWPGHDNDLRDGTLDGHSQLHLYPGDPTEDSELNQASPLRRSTGRVDAVWTQFFMNAAAAASAKIDGRQQLATRGLMQAVLDADIDDVQARLTAGQSPNQRDGLQRTSLHLAADRGDTAMLALLCDFMGDIEARDAKGNTPLHIACFRGHVGCVKFLLESASDVHVANQDGESVVHAAASGGNLPCLRFVLEYGASPFDRNKNGDTAYDILLERDGPVAHLLDCLQEAMAPKHPKALRGTSVPV